MTQVFQALALTELIKCTSDMKGLTLASHPANISQLHDLLKAQHAYVANDVPLKGSSHALIGNLCSMKILISQTELHICLLSGGH